MGNRVLWDAFVAEVERLLQSGSSGDRSASLAAYETLRPLVQGRRLSPLLERIAAGTLTVRQAGDRLFVAGHAQDGVVARAERVMCQLIEQIDVQRPLVLLHVVDDEPPACVAQEIKGVNVISMGAKEARQPRVLAHEFAHSLALADHRVLDEGWADWLEAAVFADGGFPVTRLREQARDAPPLRILLSRRWREQPLFESFADRTAAVRAACAMFVFELGLRLGTAGVIRLMNAVRDDSREDVRPLIEDIAGPLEESPDAEQHDVARPDPSVLAAVRRAFSLGCMDRVADYLRPLSAAAAADPDDEQTVAAYLMLLLLASSDGDAEAVRNCLNRELDLFVRRHGDTPLGYALSLAREGMAIRCVSDFLAINRHFGRGRAIEEAALRRFPNDFDVLVAAAKFELHTPVEYGGSKAVAVDLLLRAATAAPWREVAVELERRARSLGAAQPA